MTFILSLLALEILVVLLLISQLMKVAHRHVSNALWNAALAAALLLKELLSVKVYPPELFMSTKKYRWRVT